MNNQSTALDPDALPESIGRLVNEVCNNFEAACRNGDPARIEDFLADTTDPVRSALAQELILLEIYYGRVDKLTNPVENYRRRFPAIDSAWLANALETRHRHEHRADNNASGNGPAAMNKRNAGTPLPPNDSVLKALTSNIAGASRVHLREPDNDPPTPVVRPDSTEVPEAGRYRIDGEIARGGMGAILKGRDTELGRDIAVKVLLETHQGRTELAQRFVEEAQISGQLQHPGIVPVYELGLFADNRPYFTMKLVKGKTLAALLAERRSVAASFQLAERTRQVENLPPHTDLPRFLNIFAQVCQTLAYAHARGVIHRDLKPANIMVGNFGEVQVMDWGLAKVLQEGGVADEKKTQQRHEVSVIRTQRSQGSASFEVGSNTQAGTMLGSPAYMPPEQARGELDLIDERSDVFGLGAILCEILTSQPPYTGKAPEAMRKAQTAQVDDAYSRLDRCGTEQELIDLAKRCLAAEPWDRPANAGSVAESVNVYLNSVTERLRQAELARTAAQVRAGEERKRRRLTLALASSVLGLVVVAAAGGLWVQHLRSDRLAEDARRETEQRQAVESALDRVATLQKEARWKEAAAVAEQASERLGAAGPADLQQRIKVAQENLALVARLDSIRQQRAVFVEGHYDDRGADINYAAAFSLAHLGNERDDPDVVAVRVRDSAVREQIIAGLDDWSTAAQAPQQQAWILEVARRADPDPWRDRFRDPKIRSDRAALECLAAEVLEGNGAMLATQSPHLLTALGSVLFNLDGDAVPLLRTAQLRYPNDFWLNLRLGRALSKAHTDDEALGFHRSAVALRPDSAVAHNNLGVSLGELQRLEEAMREYRTAIELDAKFAIAHSNLGTKLRAKKQYDEATKESRKAIALDPKLGLPHSNLGNIFVELKQLDEAIKEHRTAVELDPNNSAVHSNFGFALARNKHWDDAINEFREAIRLDPKNCEPYVWFGETLCRIKRGDEAIVECRKAIVLNPKFAPAHSELGDALAFKDQFEEAIKEFRIAITLDPEEPSTHNNFGNILHRTKQFDEAVKEYCTAIKFKPKDALPHANLGSTFRAMHRLDEAINEYRLAVDLDPKDANAHMGLGNVLCDKGKLDDAIEEYRRAIQLDSNVALAHMNLGNALRDKGKLDDAIEEYRRAIQLDSNVARAHLNLGIALRDKNQLDDAMAELRRAIELDPDYAKAYFVLGLALAQKNSFSEAVDQYRAAIARNPNVASYHQNLGVSLANLRLFKEAIAEHREAVRLDDKDSTSHSNLGAALIDTWQFDEAIQECRKAIDLDPKNAAAHRNLVAASLNLGQFAKAKEAIRFALENTSPNDDFQKWVSSKLQLCDHMLALDQKLDAVLDGTEQLTDDKERLELGRHCLKPFKKLYSASARFYADAFEHDPKLADDLTAEHRYNAACAAALAGCGQGNDADKVDDKERARLRKQALDWLRADLAYWTKRAASDKLADREQVQQKLKYWGEDTDLAGIRDKDAVAKLPADEQEACKKLWAEVDAVLKKTQEKPK
jgi:serine/threonine-protein kinase